MVSFTSSAAESAGAVFCCRNFAAAGWIENMLLPIADSNSNNTTIVVLLRNWGIAFVRTKFYFARIRVKLNAASWVPAMIVRLPDRHQPAQPDRLCIGHHRRAGNMRCALLPRLQRNGPEGFVR